MIIDFRNIGGGGGSGYTLPVATSSVLGGVKIGDGINVDSAGTISVTGGTGGGVEVVTSLPASGTDGQMVLLETIVPEKIIDVSGDGITTNVTAIGITAKTKLFDYNDINVLFPVYVNANGSYSYYDSQLQEEKIFPVGETTTYEVTWHLTVTGTVTTTGCTFVCNTSTTKENVITSIHQTAEEKQVLYAWSDVKELIADIDYTTASGSNWCVRYKYSELPNATLLVTKYAYGDNYYHYVHNNGELRMYESASADTYTATTYQTIAKYGIENKGRCRIYWTDDEVVFFNYNSGQRIYLNVEDLYKTGWHKNLEHRINDKAFWSDYTYFDGDYQIIIKHPEYKTYDVALKINPASQYSNPYYVYSKSSSSIGPFFAPTTTGQTGYVCVAGNGWAAPTWVAPETITNGVKFWKGTQVEYDALSASTGYDSSTLYIITDSGSNVV